jgi:hypothetical protein
MHPPRDTAPRTSRSTLRRRLRCAPVLALLPLCLLNAGCGTRASSARRPPALVVGGRGGPVGASQLARRFAFAYARNIYRRRPPRLPGATAALSRDLAVASSRVPPARRGLHPRALVVTLRPRGAGLAGVVEIGDGRSPPFSVGFLVRKQGSRWRVVAISLPS